MTTRDQQLRRCRSTNRNKQLRITLGKSGMSFLNLIKTWLRSN